jgi:hypoxanthine phosphoribosyltransferase
MLPRVPGHRLVVTHRGADAGDLVRSDRGSDTSAIDHNTGIGLSARDTLRDPRCGIGIVNRIGGQRAEVVDRYPLSTQRRNDSRLERQSAVIAANGDSANIRSRRQTVVGSIEQIVRDDRYASRLQRVGRQRRHVSALSQRDRFTRVDDARVGFGNDLEPFHVIFRANVTTLFTAEQIQKRITELAARINADYPDGEPLHFVAVLKGAFVFLSDLSRAMSPRPTTLDFIAVSSYGAATKSSGEVRLLKDLDTPLQGRDVIIVEDIVDTGLTLNYLQDVLRARDPKSLRTACLLSKPSRRKVDVAVEYIGFEIEDKFVVGYGLDNAGQFRHLPFIGVQE